MYSTNVAFNMKTMKNVFLFFSRIPSFYKFGAYFLNFFTLRNCMPNTHIHRLRGSDGTEA